ncbi:hypothetical protein KFE25_003341 [Diacronema lutheri]|uniref:Protein kinase domain-containing protein n=1 Tax=Diacronema lutheri TaxID=2081491 RepID=A0A8J5XHJ0_DIALT|nr:hypothetical protein KFE25_003341 [Diacronema lutheri]
MPVVEDLAAMPLASHTPDGKVELDMGISGLLGCGAHGIVRVGRVLATGERVAVKVSPIAKSAKSALKELTVLTMLPSHDHVVKIESAQVNVVDGMLYLVLELCTGGELFDKIAEVGGLPEPEAKASFVQIVAALVHCHGAGVYHRDLKPENILLDKHDRVKVADFGLASTREREPSSLAHLQHTAVGSLSYAAPELHLAADGDARGYDPEKADIWSLGVVLYCMLTARLPFEVAHALLDERFAAVTREGISVMCPDSLSPCAISLLGLLLNPEPRARPSARELLSHAWLDGVTLPEPLPPPPAPAPLPPCAPPKWSEHATLVVSRDGSRTPRLQRPGKRAAASGDVGVAGRALAPPDAGGGCAGGEADASKRPRITDEDDDARRTRASGAAPAAEAEEGGVEGAARRGECAEQTALRPPPPGVPDLVRHLGWERLDGSAVELMADILKSLDELGIEYVLDRSTSSVRLPPTAALPASPGASASTTSTQLTQLAELPADEGEIETRAAEVTIRLVQSARGAGGKETVDLNFIRARGSTIAFHSIYNAFRGQMAARSGWCASSRQYEVLAAI